MPRILDIKISTLNIPRRIIRDLFISSAGFFKIALIKHIKLSANKYKDIAKTKYRIIEKGKINNQAL
jgi:hypothetical protein